jgi:hypothetical protein
MAVATPRIVDPDLWKQRPHVRVVPGAWLNQADFRL